MDQEPKKNDFSIPVAIVLAGVIIAGALFFSRGGTNVLPSGQNTGNNFANLNIKIAPITSQDHILGNPNAKAVFVEYSDTECSFCKTFHDTMHQVVNNFGKDGSVAWVYRHFPIKSSHPLALKQAEATECAAELGGNSAFWKYIDEVFATTTSNNTLDPAKLPLIATEIGLDKQAFNTCLDSGKYASTIDNAVKAAVEAGARGTPYNIILLKDKASDQVKSLIDDAVTQFRLNPSWLYITPDEKKIVMSGAMPYDLIEVVVKAIIGN